MSTTNVTYSTNASFRSAQRKMVGGGGGGEMGGMRDIYGSKNEVVAGGMNPIARRAEPKLKVSSDGLLDFTKSGGACETFSSFPPPKQKQKPEAEEEVRRGFCPTTCTTEQQRQQLGHALLRRA